MAYMKLESRSEKHFEIIQLGLVLGGMRQKNKDDEKVQSN